MKKNRLLIIDDDPDFLESLRVRLENKNFLVHTASSGKEGLKAIEAINPDLILMDIMMETDLEGYDMLETLRNRESMAEIPVILHSGMLEVVNPDLRAAVEEIESYHNVAFVDKADDLEELIFRIDRLLDQ